MQELVALQQRAAAADGADGAATGPAADGVVVSGSPPGGGAWATVGKKNKAATMRGEEDVQVSPIQYPLDIIELCVTGSRLIGCMR